MQLIPLEFPKILEQLARHTMFSASKELALALQPTPYFTEASARQAETTEAVRLLSVKVDIGIGGARDVRLLVAKAQRGAVLIPLELLEIQQTLIAARDLQRAIDRLADDFPHLADIAQRIAFCPGLINDISSAIDERGEVKSSASTTMANIRQELNIVHNRLLEKLNRLVTSSNYAQYLQEPIITQRNGRYVIPLKAEFKGRVQGIIHDQSGSGVTLFIEPLATVELNNRWRQLQLDEEDEIRRILTALSQTVSDQGTVIKHTVEALADLDLAFAKAKYALAMKATAPMLFDFGSQESSTRPPTLCLKSARHPLLNPKTAVPIDVTLPTETHILVITGPNTGGKTVSLKTVGVLALMAQAGLWLPVAEGSSLPVFNQILADIGDEQSIEQSLSTFSGHMTHLVKILAQCDHRSLVVLDELGAGTDPIEGSALARSVLSYLLTRQVTTFVATHYSELKAYAHSTPGVTNASMEFDLDTLSPTYRLLIGLPGASNAFTIAERLGLPLEIINQARGLIGEDTQQIEAMLAEIKAQTESARQLRQQAETTRQNAEQYHQTLQSRLADIETEKRTILNSAREDARHEIKTVREQVRVWQQEAEKNRALMPQETVKEVDAPLAQIAQQLAKLDVDIEAKTKPVAPPIPAKKSPVKRSIVPGDTVFVAQFATEGEVISVQHKQVEVQLGHFRTTVALSGVELRKKAKKEASPDQTYHVPIVESPGMELDLRGQVASEALDALDRYLDQAFMAHLPWVRIIHGKGSGVLRQAVRQALNGHALVSSHRSGGDGEGGEGVTVAKLAIG